MNSDDESRRAAARIMLARESANKATAAPPPKRARIMRGPEDVPDGTHITTADDGTLESFERAVLGALLWRRPEAAELSVIPTAGSATKSGSPVSPF